MRGIVLVLITTGAVLSESPVAAASPCAAQITGAQRGLSDQFPARGRAVYAIGNPNGGPIEEFEGPWGRPYRSFVLGSFTLERRGPWKGLNTAFAVRRVSRDGMVRDTDRALLAWKVLPRSGRTARVYTPASDALLAACPAVVQSGRALLDLRVREALAALRHRHSTSRADDDVLVADVVPREILHVLFRVEKLDPCEFQRCRGDMTCIRALLRKIMLVLGANRDTAWRYAQSSAGARGPMQFMPGTWAMVQAKYPTAMLPAFTDGAGDLAMSLRAAALLIDSNLELLDSSHRVFLRANPQAFARYAAAAYNGNPKWAIDAIPKCGENWTERSCGVLRPETVVYLDKVDAVWPIVTVQARGRGGDRAVAPRSRLASHAGGRRR